MKVSWLAVLLLSGSALVVQADGRVGGHRIIFPGRSHAPNRPRERSPSLRRFVSRPIFIDEGHKVTEDDEENQREMELIHHEDE